MFPALEFVVKGLESHAQYKLVLEIRCADWTRYRYIHDRWCSTGKSNAVFPSIEPFCVHPDSPNTGLHWMKGVVSFKKTAKLTNNAKTTKHQVNT